MHPKCTLVLGVFLRPLDKALCAAKLVCRESNSLKRGASHLARGSFRLSWIPNTESSRFFPLYFH